jgi:hypothetical protein
MQTASIDDRASIEAIYPPAAFDEDAARNAAGDADVLYGLRVEAVPDAEGRFIFARSRQHAGEARDPTEALFLSPDGEHLLAAAASSLRTGEEEAAAAKPDERRKAYARFIDRVIEAVRAADFQKPIGRGEERLEGFHGG